MLSLGFVSVVLQTFTGQHCCPRHRFPALALGRQVDWFPWTLIFGPCFCLHECLSVRLCYVLRGLSSNDPFCYVGNFRKWLLTSPFSFPFFFLTYGAGLLLFCVFCFGFVSAWNLAFFAGFEVGVICTFSTLFFLFFLFLWFCYLTYIKRGWAVGLECIVHYLDQVFFLEAIQ